MSANSALVNAHINRVIDEGGDVATIDQAWLQAAYQWLVDNGLEKTLLHWVDPAFGVLKSGSDITRIYDLGSTYLPRTLDLTSRDSTKTTYNATGVGGFPAFVNSDGSSQLYWGRGNRFAQIRRQQQITIAAFYERSQTGTDVCLVGASTTTPSGAQVGGVPTFGGGALIPGLSLVHVSGTPGSVQFSLSDKSLTSRTASVTASGASAQVAVGTYDGTTMTAYSDGTGGTGVTSLFKDPYFAGEQALSGPRGAHVNVPFLCVGDTKPYAAFDNPNNPPFSKTLTYTNAYAQFKGGSIIVLGVALTPTQVTSLTSLLQTHGTTTVDIKVDYGATGDGQIMTTNCTIPTGGNNKRLTTAATRFVVGDVGKYIAITGAVPVDSLNPLGALITTIASFNATDDVVLTDAAANTLVASSQQVEWGHDDYAAFKDFRDDFTGQSGIVLDIPAGHYLMLGLADAATLQFTRGITGFHMAGVSSATTTISDVLGTGYAWWLGGSIGTLTGDVLLTASVSAGATSVTLSTPGEHTYFATNTWACMTGLDVQGFGSPPNYQFHEYVYITGINTSTGEITFQSPLVNSYSSQWPEWIVGTGGPAALCPTQAAWDCDQEYSDITFLQNYTVTNCNGRNITFTGCDFPGYGPNCSTQKDFTLSNTSISTSGNWEVDKVTGDVTISGGTYHNIAFQSPSVAGTFTMSNVHVDSQLTGSGLNNVLDTVTVDGFTQLGATAYGASRSFTATDCTFTGGFGFTGLTEADTQIYYTMSAGVISYLYDITIVTNGATASGDVLHFAPGVIPTDAWIGMSVRDVTTPGAIRQTIPRPTIASFDSVAGTLTMSEAVLSAVGSGDSIRLNGGTPPWAIPGTPCFFGRLGSAALGNSSKQALFNISTVATDGTRLAVTTDLGGTFPTLPGTGNLAISTHSAPEFQLVNCTGDREAVAMSGFSARGAGEAWSYTYSTDIGTTQAVVPVCGEVISVTFNITATFGAGTMTLDGPYVVQMSDGSLQTWNPVVDLTRGPRVITVTPSGVTSTPVAVGGADANLTLPASDGIWLMPEQVTPKMFSVSAPGAVTLSFNLDQGIVAATDPTTTAVVSSTNPSALGASVTFTATVSHVSGVSTPTGTVTFYDSATPLGSDSLDGSAQAAISTSALGAGSHSITAVYGGDANYDTSTSSPLTQVVTGGVGPGGMVVFTTMM